MFLPLWSHWHHDFIGVLWPFRWIGSESWSCRHRKRTAVTIGQRSEAAHKMRRSRVRIIIIIIIIIIIVIPAGKTLSVKWHWLWDKRPGFQSRQGKGFFWCEIWGFHSGEDSSRGLLPQHYTVSQTRRPWLEAFFLFATVFKRAPISTQPPIQWVLGSLSLRIKLPGHEANHSTPPSAEDRNAWSFTSFPLCPHDGVVLN
jgi:hypothetical protein